jgi:hypothetical protein
MVFVVSFKRSSTSKSSPDTAVFPLKRWAAGHSTMNTRFGELPVVWVRTRFDGPLAPPMSSPNAAIAPAKPSAELIGK